MITDPEALGCNIAHVVHVRSHSFMGRAIRRCFPGPDGELLAWGNHDGLLAYIQAGDGYPVDDGWHVAESLGRGYVLTPWGEYVRAVYAGSNSIVLYRIAGVDVITANLIAQTAITEALRHLATGEHQYDRVAIYWKLIGAIVGKRIDRHRESDWYCTESTRAVCAVHGIDPWRKVQPTPYTTEKREQQGALEIVAELTAPGDVSYAAWKDRT